MIEPQVWTMIALIAAVFFGTMTLISAMFTRVIRSEIGGLRGEMNARFETVNARFDAMNKRMNNLDRDIKTLTEREINRDN